MNKYIKEQLNKCKVAKVPYFDDNTTELSIPFDTSNLIPGEFYINMEYNIEVEDYIIHPFPGFNLHDNYNNGIVPTDKFMHIKVLKDMGKMMQIMAIGLNDGQGWSGYLPKKSCKRIY